MILAEGLAYDKCLVGVVTDMDGHETLGDLYIDDADAMANVVRTQVDVILPDGVAVLSAANAAVADLASLCDGKVIFYAADPSLPVVTAHLASGERAVVLKDGVVTLAEGASATALLPLSALNQDAAGEPDTVLAAVAATWAMGVEPDLIAAGLRTCQATRTTV